MKKTIIAIAIVMAIAVAMPFSVFADDSDAYTMTAGKSGIGYSFENLSKTDMNRILSDSEKMSMASTLFGNIVNDTSVWEIKDIAVKNYSASEYKGTDVSDNILTTVESTKKSYDISFKATCVTADKTMFYEKNVFVDVITKIGADNKTQLDAVMTIDATVETTYSETITSVLVENSLDEYFESEIENKYSETSFRDMSAKYSYKDGSEPSSIEFKMSTSDENALSGKKKYDFMGRELKDVRDNMYCYADSENAKSPRKFSEKVVFDGSERVTKAELDEKDMDVIFSMGLLSRIYVYHRDIVAPEYKFYGDDEGLFHDFSVADDKLKSNSAMKDFLSSVGSVTEDYDEAKSKTNSLHRDVSLSGNGNNTPFIIIIGVLSVVAAGLAVAIVVILKKR